MAKYEVLVCASQLRWSFPPQEANGVLAQGTVILAQQYKEEHHQTQQRSSYLKTQTQSTRSLTEYESLNTTLYYGDIPRYIPDSYVPEPPVDREAGLRRLAYVSFLSSRT